MIQNEYFSLISLYSSVQFREFMIRTLTDTFCWGDANAAGAVPDGVRHKGRRPGHWALGG